MASIIPGFAYDIFISYRQKDNKYDGWVTEFVGNLRKELEATFKEDVSIYFDENPHDGLLETHHVGKSLEGKLKCVILIPVISQTYCDPKSFAWQHEFLAFADLIKNDSIGPHVRVSNGNIASRILPVRIHDLDPEDIQLYEKSTGEVLRPVDFIYRLPGVNRQLRAKDDEQKGSEVLYRDQINKVARAIKEVMNGIKHADGPVAPPVTTTSSAPSSTQASAPATPSKKSITMPKKGAVLIVASGLVMAILAAMFVPGWMNERRMRSEVLPAIQKLIDDNFQPPPQAFLMAEEAAHYIPDDSALINLWPKISRKVNIDTDPEGAEVYWTSYEDPSQPWKLLGTTPLKEVRIPNNIRMKIQQLGYQDIVMTSGRIVKDNAYKLDPVGSIPDGMVRIPSRVSLMNIIGLEQYAGKKVGSFLVDKQEVTNKDFKRFVEEGGYNRPDLWQGPFILDGKKVDFATAMKQMTDKTGRPGPATWEAGTYPTGQDDFPVSGVSWHEAAAYAKFVDKQLPTVYHWSVLAETSRTLYIIPQSNFNGTGPVAAGSTTGISSYGIYDMAGNVREWTANAFQGRDMYYILGGGWSDATYAFNDASVAGPFDRSQTNGFRCMKALPDDETLAALTVPVALAFRDYRVEKPVDDKTFELIRRYYDYDRSPMHPAVEEVADTSIWKIQRVTMEAAYPNDKLVVYICLPRNAKPPYQPILLFPGSNVIYDNAVTANHLRRLDFIIKSGRAIVMPVFKGTFERRDELNSDLADESVFYRDHVIMWRKDMGRTIDYLETREDLITSQLGYFGWSWGGYMGGILPALEPRIKALVLHVGGMEMNKSLPEVDQLNFLPRVKQPTLMLNGKHDMFFPVETSQKPMFDFLGTDPKDKKIMIYNAGHLVPRTELIKESLAWYDRYLGPVK